jgi:hypothetical protein
LIKDIKALTLAEKSFLLFSNQRGVFVLNMCPYFFEHKGVNNGFPP